MLVDLVCDQPDGLILRSDPLLWVHRLDGTREKASLRTSAHVVLWHSVWRAVGDFLDELASTSPEHGAAPGQLQCTVSRAAVRQVAALQAGVLLWRAFVAVQDGFESSHAVGVCSLSCGRLPSGVRGDKTLHRTDGHQVCSRGHPTALAHLSNITVSGRTRLVKQRFWYTGLLLIALYLGRQRKLAVCYEVCNTVHWQAQSFTGVQLPFKLPAVRGPNSNSFCRRQPDPRPGGQAGAVVSAVL